jgi:hypothetical protein
VTPEKDEKMEENHSSAPFHTHVSYADFRRRVANTIKGVA